jgi:hypothetical protein
MTKVTITFEVDLPDTREVDAQVENILHDMRSGMVCRPMELLTEALASEPVASKRLISEGWSEDRVRVYLKTIQDSYVESHRVQSALWDSRKVSISSTAEDVSNR